MTIESVLPQPKNNPNDNIKYSEDRSIPKRKVQFSNTIEVHEYKKTSSKSEPPTTPTHLMYPSATQGDPLRKIDYSYESWLKSAPPTSDKAQYGKDKSCDPPCKCNIS